MAQTYARRSAPGRCTVRSIIMQEIEAEADCICGWHYTMDIRKPRGRKNLSEAIKNHFRQHHGTSGHEVTKVVSVTTIYSGL